MPFSSFPFPLLRLAGPGTLLLYPSCRGDAPAAEAEKVGEARLGIAFLFDGGAVSLPLLLSSEQTKRGKTADHWKEELEKGRKKKGRTTLTTFALDTLIS